MTKIYCVLTRNLVCRRYLTRGSLFHDSMTPETMTPTKLKDDSRWLVLGLVKVRVRVKVMVLESSFSLVGVMFSGVMESLNSDTPYEALFLESRCLTVYQDN